MTKNFCYLAQGRASNLRKLLTRIPDDADLVLLSYDEEINYNGDFISYFLPKSTWAEGRNYLIENVDRCYRFYIFLDDDVFIKSGSFQAFQEKLIKYKPRAAVPLVDQIKRDFRYLPDAVLQETIVFDQVMQAFRNDVLFGDGYPMRYDTKFDHVSWWFCCEINQLELVIFHGPVVQFNDVMITNQNHHVETGNQVGSIYNSGNQKIRLSFFYRHLLSKHNKKLGFLIIYTYYLGKCFPYGPGLGVFFSKDYHAKYRNDGLVKRFARAVWVLFKLLIRVSLHALGVTPFKKLN